MIFSSKYLHISNKCRIFASESPVVPDASQTIGYRFLYYSALSFSISFLRLHAFSLQSYKKFLTFASILALFSWTLPLFLWLSQHLHSLHITSATMRLCDFPIHLPDCHSFLKSHKVAKSHLQNFTSALFGLSLICCFSCPTSSKVSSTLTMVLPRPS